MPPHLRVVVVALAASRLQAPHVLDEELDARRLGDSGDEGDGRLLVTRDGVVVCQLGEEGNDVARNVAVFVREEVEKRAERGAADEDAVQVGGRGEDSQALQFGIELHFGVHETRGLARILCSCQLVPRDGLFDAEEELFHAIHVESRHVSILSRRNELGQLVLR